MQSRNHSQVAARDTLPRRILGRTGLEVSVLGMGGVGAMGKYGPVTRESFALTMTRAAELGMNFLDTSPDYGDSEAVFGYYLQDHRDDWIVCTKVGGCLGRENLTRQQVLEQLPQSLERLRVDYADVVLIHSIHQYGKGAAAIERLLAPGGAVEGLKELQEEGKVRFIGVSGHVPELLPALATDLFDVALTYNSFNLLMQYAHKELFPLAQKHNVGIVVAGAFYQGLLTPDRESVLQRKDQWFERDDPGYYRTQELLDRLERLRDLVGGDDQALRSLALRFAFSHPAISLVISGMTCCEEVEENVAATLLGPLSTDELQQVADVLGTTLSW